MCKYVLREACVEVLEEFESYFNSEGYSEFSFSINRSFIGGKGYSDLPVDVRYKYLRRMIANCGACDVRKESSFPVAPFGGIDSEWVFIGRNPDKVDDQKRTPFTPGGMTGEAFRHYLRLLGLERAEVYTTNALKCLTLNERPPRDYEVGFCARWLRMEFALLQKKKMVFLVGNDAVRAFFGVESDSIMLRWGKFYAVSEGGVRYWVVPLLHPGHVKSEPGLGVELGRVLSICAGLIREIRSGEESWLNGGEALAR